MNAPATLNVHFSQQNIEKTIFTDTNPAIPLSIEAFTLEIATSDAIPRQGLSFKITGPNKISELNEPALHSIVYGLHSLGHEEIFTTDTVIYCIDSNHGTSYQSLGGIISLAGKTIDIECLGETYRCELPLLSDTLAFGTIVSQGYFVFNIVT